jgi:hypothetical protein
MLTRRRVFAASAAGFVSAASGVVPQAFAQLDRKLVRIIVGFPPGSADVIARILADRLQLPYASTVIVENKPDASGRLAVEYVKNAEPDGSVLLFTPEGPIAVFPHVDQWPVDTGIEMLHKPLTEDAIEQKVRAVLNRLVDIAGCLMEPFGSPGFACAGKTDEKAIKAGLFRLPQPQPGETFESGKVGWCRSGEPWSGV